MTHEQEACRLLRIVWRAGSSGRGISRKSVKKVREWFKRDEQLKRDKRLRSRVTVS